MEPNTETIERLERLGPLAYTKGDVLEGRYKIGRAIAVGGQGLLRYAEGMGDGREVVVKKYSNMEDAVDWDSLDEGEVGFAREIKFLGRANRDNIKGVTELIEFGVTGAFREPVSILEPIKGQTVKEIALSPGYSPSLTQILETGETLSRVLNYAHTSGDGPTANRDVSGNNVIINSEGSKIVDWASATPTSGKTYHPRSFILTPDFTAPEILAGRPFDGRADQYGAGKVLQFMWLPNLFLDKSGMIDEEDFEHLKVPRNMVKALSIATRQEPENRYSDMRNFYKALSGNSLSARIEPSSGQNPPAESQTREEQESISLAPRESLVLAPSVVTGKPRRLKGSFAREFIERYEAGARDLGNPDVLDVLNFSRISLNPFKGVVTGGNAFSSALTAKVLRDMGYRSATRPDVEKMPLKRLRFFLNYIDVGVALRTRQDPNEPNNLLSRILYDDLEQSGINVQERGGKLVSYNALSLERNSNSKYGGLIFRLNPDSVTQNDILNLGDFKWERKRNEGLSQAWFDGLGWYSRGEGLADSYCYGRVVAVSAEGTRAKQTERIDYEADSEIQGIIKELNQELLDRK